jgi:uncharacterized protein YigE (DUF2233 family)
VSLTRIKDPLGPYRIKVVTVDLDASATLDVALASDELPGFETTSSMAGRHDALAAINGDYARPSGRPVFTFAEDGHLDQTPLSWGRNFAVDRTETATYMGHPNVATWVYEHDSGLQQTIARVNAGAPDLEELAFFTEAGGREERPPRSACSARLVPNNAPRSSAAQPGVEIPYTVNKVSCGYRRMSRMGGVVLAAPIGGNTGWWIAALTPGEQLTVGWSLGWYNVFDTVGGNPTMIENGSIIPNNVYGSDAFFHRHPRTGVGTTPDGRVLLVTVDGRQPKWSVGMTLGQFATLFKQLGATWALNLDGGGSTTTWVNGSVMNRPSDGYERAVSSALLVLPAGDPGEVEPAPDPPTGISLAKVTAWPAISRDPGSTGGMAAAMLARGFHLDRALGRAAKRFERR